VTTNLLTRTNYILVTNLPPLAADFTAGPANGAVPLTVSFTNLSTGATNYSWAFGDGNSSAVLNPGNTYTNAGTYTVTLTAIGPEGTNSITRVGYVTATNAPLLIDVILVTGADYTQNFDSMGPTGTTAPTGWFAGTGTGAISGKTVTPGDGSSNTGGNYNFGASGSSDRALGSLASASTQRDTEARFINISGSLINSFTISYTGEEWRVGGNGSVNNDLVLQYSTDGTNFGLMGAQFNFNTPVDSGSAAALDGNAAANRVTGNGGTYSPPASITNGQSFYLRWADANDPSADNAMAVDNFAISFTLSNPPPPVVAGFTGSPTSGVAALSVAFTNLSSGATNYSWDFGDGNGSADTNQSNTYSNAGTYTVTLTATGPGGTDTLVRTNYVVVANPPPPVVIADFAGGPMSGVAPLSVVFTNLSSGATAYSWDFGDGNNSVAAAPGNTYTNAGTYTVGLTATGTGGTNILFRTNYILVLGPPQLVINPATLDFGMVFTNTTAQASFVISNTGGTLLSGTATVALNPFFILDSAPVSNLGFTVPALSSTNLALGFSPTLAGQFSDVVEFASNGGGSTNSISGQGVNAPVLLTPVISGPDLVFTFETIVARAYAIEYKDALEAPAWLPLQTVSGDGTLKMITTPVSLADRRFFRLLVQ